MATKSVEVDIRSAPVELLRRIKRANPHDRRSAAAAASGHHGNRHHGDQQQRHGGTAHPLETAALAHRALVRRNRIRRDGTTPGAAGSRAPVVLQPPTFHPSAPHRRIPAKPPRDEPKLKLAARAGKPRRRKFVRRRGGGHPLASSLMDLRSFRTRDRETPKPRVAGGNKTLTATHHHKQKARPLVSGHRVYRPGFGTATFSTPPKHPVSADRRPDSAADKIQAHPAAVDHVGVPPRRRAPVSASGSGEHRRRLPVVQQMSAAGRSHREARTRHVLPALHRRRIQTTDGYRLHY